MFCLFVLVIFCLIALREWLLRRSLSQKTIEKIQKKVAQEIAMGNWESAAKELKPLKQKRLGGLETILFNVQILLGNKCLPEALRYVEESLLSYQDDFSLYKEKAKVLLALGKPKEALECFKKSEVLLHGEEDFLDLATALFQTGDVDGAWYYLREILKDVKNGRVLALAGDCHFYLGEYKEAIGFYRQALEIGWNNYQVLARMGHSLRSIGKLPEAESFFSEILEKDPSDVSSTLGLGACLEAKGMYGKALLVYQTGKAWDFGDENILLQAGICAIYTHKYDFAEMYLRESIKRGAKSPESLAFLGYSLEKQTRWEDAERVYMRLVDDYPEHIAGYRALAWIYGVGHSSSLSEEEGLIMARKALKLQPDAVSWEALSACEARAGNFKKAHNIQERLSSQANNETTRMRRCKAMRVLRKKRPLDENHVSRILVA